MDRQIVFVGAGNTQIAENINIDKYGIFSAIISGFGGIEYTKEKKATQLESCAPFFLICLRYFLQCFYEDFNCR